MQAITFEQFGNASVLKQTEVPAPRAAAGEVLIRVAHTSVNPVDWKIREGYLQGMLPHRFPIIPGWDAAGQIVDIGEGVKGFSRGDEVYAYTRLPEVHSGTYAELISVPAAFVAKKPKSLSTAEAASIPLVALTAYQGLHEATGIKAGERVLVTAGAGGVGSFAIQFAKAVGAHVTATAGTANQQYLKELGADVTIDYTKEDVAEAARRSSPNGYDVIFDAVGGASLSEAAQLIKDGGRVVSIVDTPAASLFSGKNVDAKFHFVYPNGEQLREIAKLIDEGKVVTPAINVLSIKQAASAQEESQKRHVRGKLVLSIDF